MHLLLTSLAITANLLGAGMALPQARRLARTRQVDGVSAAWAGVSMVLNAWWFAYGVAAQLWVLLPVSAVSFALYAAIIVMLVRTAGWSSLIGVSVGVFVLGMVPAPALLVGGWTMAGLAIGLSYGVQLLPAVIAAYRTRLLAGVSPGTWLLAWAEAMLWLWYGIGIADAPLIAAGVVGAGMASVILVRLAVTGHRPLDSIRWSQRAAMAR